MGQDHAGFSGIHSMGLGGTGLNELHAASLWQNPALLSKLIGWNFTSEFNRPIYTLPVGISTVNASKGNGIHGVSVGFSRLGIQNMADQLISAGYGIRLNSKISLGIRLDINQLSAVSRGFNAHYLTGGMGLYYHLNEKFDLAVFIFNPNRSSFLLDNQYYRSFSSWEFGLKHTLSEDLSLRIEARHESSLSELEWQSGLQYILVKNFQLLFGYRSLSKKYSIGTSFSNRHLDVHIASVWHPDLGFGGGIGLQYALD